MHNKRTETSAQETRTTEQQAKAQANEAPRTPAAELDFESLDLSIETVEERISPSETNVFDK